MAGKSGRLVDPSVTPDQRTYATFMHLMLVIATVTAVPLVLGPLIMWLIKRDTSPFIDDHGREALNFNISILIYMLLSGLLFICGVGVVVMPVVWVFGIVFSIIAAIAANRGEYYRYPACIRLIA
jgi:uncharacterized Tic20 family protein